MSRKDIRERVEAFLGDWDRNEWMNTHAGWDHEYNTWTAGTVDPHGVSERAEYAADGYARQAWGCFEGWEAFRDGDALYLRQWRKPDGPLSGRVERDLWVLVDRRFFRGD